MQSFQSEVHHIPLALLLRNTYIGSYAKRNSFMKKNIPFLSAGIAGASAIALVIIGSRLLAPFCGTTLYLWSVLLGTALLALIAGYWLDSRWPDKNPVNWINVILLGAGIWTILIAWMKHPLLHIIEPLGLRIAALTAVFILFFLPFFLIGKIYSLAVRLGTAGERIGRTSDYFTPLSAISGTVLAYATTTDLLLHMGVTRSLILVGIALLATSAFGWLAGAEKRSIKAGAAAIVVGIFSIIYIPMWEFADPSRGLIAVEQSRYSELRVIDTEAGRYLLQNGKVIGFTDQTASIPYLHSTAVMELPKLFFDKPGKALLVGLGAGSSVKQYSSEGWNIDAVEPDPAIIQMARQYFRLESWRGSLCEMEIRGFFTSARESYDVILIDTRASASPADFMKKEILELAASRVQPNGILAINIETIGWDDPLVARLGSALKQHFQNVLALPMEEPPDQVGDVVLIASNSQLRPVRTPPVNLTYDPDWRFGPGYQRVHAWDNRFVPVAKNPPSFFDNLNPFDNRTDAINFAARREFFANFKEKDLIW